MPALGRLSRRRRRVAVMVAMMVAVPMRLIERVWMGARGTFD